jgi:cytochrome c-type biogenesis protein CcmF
MIPELGHFALILSLCMAVVLAVVPLVGSFAGLHTWMGLARPLAWGQFTFLSIALYVLTRAFLVDDFSVLYVAQHGNTLLPIMYKISAVWGAHEGSLLLWAWILGGWTVAVAMFSRKLPDEVLARVLAVMGMIAIGFLSFMLFTSNPFERMFPVPAEGGDLNPLLQDPGLAIHPPMLYMGYVGLSVAFAFALAALMGGKLDAAWARWSRPWTLVAWVFLTIGIVLGSWWAYYELGWGGWWFWDPVENASFMPWLAGTALVHSLAVTEKRGAFKRWTVLLALTAFSLSLLGTFLVRSGVLTSVHAFATDPERGLFILAFLLLVIGGSLFLYALRAPGITRGGGFGTLSRESFLLGNNVLLVLLTALVLFGTLAPLIYEAFGKKISVGFPWFNSMFVMFSPLLVLLMGAGPLVRWKHHDPQQLLQRLRIAFFLSLACGILASLPFVSGSLSVGLAVALSLWLATTLLSGAWQRLRAKGGLSALGRDIAGRGGRSYYGMWLAHIGVAFFVVGVTVVTQFDIEKDVRMSPGERITLNAFTFQFDGVKKLQGPNYIADHGVVRVFKGEREIAVLEPEKRVYSVQKKPMTEAGINAGFTRDIYVSLGEHLGGGDWSLRLYYKPLVRWIWLGGLLIAAGGLLAASDPRYRHLMTRRSAAATPASGDAAEGRA